MDGEGEREIRRHRKRGGVRRRESEIGRERERERQDMDRDGYREIMIDYHIVGETMSPKHHMTSDLVHCREAVVRCAHSNML